ncbi:MAG: diguanylate cyclase [Rhodocyclales bacterium GT-UBC]|nr:MAG: diguanylate cyclase [Rhodocyclales bacterium GT-UBC]
MTKLILVRRSIVIPPHALLRLVYAALLSALWSPANALEAVRLQLKWTHAFQFAGYYAAQEQGYYREAGLDVSLVEATPGSDPVRAVIDGQAQYGVSTSSLLLLRKAGEPVVVLANIFQHSPLVLIALQERATQNIHNLVDRPVMLEKHADELLAYLKQEGVPPQRLQLVEHSFDTRDLIDGKVAAMSAYVTQEPFDLEQSGLPYQTYTPRSVGIDFYGDNLFTTEDELKRHPERVRAFRAASLRGWQYAMEHPEEIVDLIVRQYPGRHPREFYLFEAQRMVDLLQTDLIEIGYMHPGRWRDIADTYAKLGLLRADFSLAGFLYQPDQESDLSWLYPASALLLLVSAIVAYVLRINRRLSRALSDSKTAHQALQLSETRYRLLADNASDVIWTTDLQCRFTYISPSIRKLRGYTASEAMAQSVEEHLMPGSVTIAQAGLKGIIEAIGAGRPSGTFRAEVEQPCKDGSTVWTEISVSAMSDESGQAIGLLGLSRDISMRRETEELLRQMAQHDPLTHLPNRILFSDRLQQALADARRNQTRLAVMFIDLDNFKPINDSLGHAVGDLLLQEAALRMQACVRQSDTVARIGGDEFVVLLRQIEHAHNARQVGEKIRLALCQPFALAGQVLGISASIGIALYPEHGQEEIALAKQADLAMYRAKALGRNTIQLAEAP